MKFRHLAFLLGFSVVLVSTGWAQAKGQETAERLRLAEERAYWFARYNLNALVLMSGMGERLKVPPEKSKALAASLGFDLRQLPKNPYLLRSVYASGELYFVKEGDFRDLSTLYWDRSKIDRTLDPAAHAMVVINAADKRLRSRYHETPKDKFIAAVQINEAIAIADTLENRLKRPDGRYAPKRPDDTFLEPRLRDQFLALRAYSKLSAFLSDPAFPYAHRPREAERFLSLAGKVYKRAALESVSSIPDMSIALEAAIGYAESSNRPDVDAKIRALLVKLKDSSPGGSVEAAFKVRGLAVAAGHLQSRDLMREAEASFRRELMTFWDEKTGVFRTGPKGQPQVFTPFALGAHFGALNALRKNPLVTAETIQEGNLRFTELFESAVLASGLQYSHAIPLAVNPLYRKRYPRAYFTAPRVPLSVEAGGRYGFGGCPMFQKEIRLGRGFWSYKAEGQYETFPALFLADMITPGPAATRRSSIPSPDRRWASPIFGTALDHE